MSDSDSSESSSDEEIIERAPVVAQFTVSDDEEETKRTVRTAKEKRFEELNNVIKSIKNSKKNNDIGKIAQNFEELRKAFIRAKAAVIDKEDGGKIPVFFIRCLSQLDEYVKMMWEGKKITNKGQKSALQALRQKLRKYIKDNFETEMTNFQENPEEEHSDQEAADSDAEQGSDADDDQEDVPTASSFKKEASVVSSDRSESLPPAAGDDDDDSDSTDWGSDDESSSSDSDTGGPTTLMRERFLKKTVSKEEEENKRKKKEEKAERKKELKAAKEGEEQWETVQKGAQAAAAKDKPKMFGKDDEINVQTVMAKLTEVTAARGKKSTDRKDQIKLAREIMKVAREHNLGMPVYIKIQYQLITSTFDYSRTGTDAMKIDQWEKALKRIDEFINMLCSAPNISMNESITEETESLETAPYKIHGDAMTIIERMDDEFVKLVKAADAHSNEYITRLRYETKVCHLIDAMIKYQEKQGHVPDVCRIYLRKIEHVYYKYDQRAADMVHGKIPTTNDTSIDVMDKLCSYIYKRDSNGRLRTRAVLCHIYHMAVHDNNYDARDLLLMSHLQETIMNADVPTFILYNRTLSQLGLCQFRAGHITEAHDALVDIQSGGRAKELLAQGLLPTRQVDRTAEQEKTEKSRQIPFHMHINLEVLECCYLVCAMLVEIPYMAAHEFDARRRMISKSFHHQLKNSERQSLVGPPESMREHVVAASKAMRNGDWTNCVNLLLNPKMNAKVWDLFHNSESVKEMLKRKVQEESLRTYIFTHSQVYDSISLVYLSSMFSLPDEKVHAVISKMIINKEVMGSLDEPTQCLVMHKTEPSGVQSLVLQAADKLHNLVENNDRVLDQKPFFQRGNMGGFRDRNQNWGGQNRRGGDDRRGGGGYRGGDDRRTGGYNRGGDDRRGGGGGYRGGRGGGGYHGNRDDRHGHREDRYDTRR